MNSISLRAMRGLLLREVITLLLFAGLMLQSVTAVAPDWWTTRGALMPDADSDDFAVANVGQLKNIAQKAAQEMNDSLTGGAGTAINAIVNSWAALPAAGVVRDDYAALTLGQLKAVAKPYYDRLAAVGLRVANTYPWTGTTPDDYALANLGQLKTVFAFAVPPVVQLASQTGIPSSQLLAAVQAWQTVPMDQRAENATLEDLDGDGISNLQEYLMGTPLFDPTDIDGDRIPNTVEDLYPGIMSKSRFADAVEDYDGDGVMNYEEIQLSLSLSAASSGRSDGLNDAQVLATHLKQTLPGTVREMEQRVLWDSSISILNDYDIDDGLLTGHPEWQSQADANANGLPDGWEAYIAAYVPPIIRTTYTDCDGDLMSDVWEYRYQFDLRDAGDAGSDLFSPTNVPQVPVAPNPANYNTEDYVTALSQYQSALSTYTQRFQTDPDLDHLCNLREYYLGSNPRLADTNGDGTTDETAILTGLDPSGGGANQGTQALADDDGDGIPNIQELKLGLNPFQSNADQDQDHDGFTDVEEALAGSDVFDRNSRCGPVITAMQNSYSFEYIDAPAWNGSPARKTFSGHAMNNNFYNYFADIQDTGNGKASNQGSAIREAFEDGDFGNPSDLDFPPLYMGDEELPRSWSSNLTENGESGGDSKISSWGYSSKFSILKATIPNPPPVPWTRLYLVKKYTGDVSDYPAEGYMIFGEEVGMVVFSQDEAGNQSVSYQGDDTDEIKVAADNESVTIIAPEVENEWVSYRLTPVKIIFEAPETIQKPTDPVSFLPATEPLAAGGSPPVIADQQDFEKISVITDSQFRPVPELKIAKLTNALKPVNPNRSTYTVDDTNDNDFVLDNSTESDVFRITVTGLTSDSLKQYSLKLRTEGTPAQGHFEQINDAPTQIPLRDYPSANGLITTRQILVAHQEDDEYPVHRSIAPDPPNYFRRFGIDEVNISNPDVSVASDRTHRAIIDSQVVVDSIIETKGGVDKIFTLKNVRMPVKERKKVTVAVYAFNDSGVVENGQVASKVWNDLQTARNTLAQIGVTLELETGFPQVITLPQGQDSEVKAYEYAIGGATPASSFGIPSVKGKQLIDLQLAKAKEVKQTSRFTLIYCKALSSERTPDGYAGYAYTMLSCSGANAAYNNHAFVAGFYKNNSRLALVHELVHLLTNNGHFGESYPLLRVSADRVWNNLMRGGVPNIVPGIGDGCRLEKLQQNLIDSVLSSTPIQQ